MDSSSNGWRRSTDIRDPSGGRMVEGGRFGYSPVILMGALLDSHWPRRGLVSRQAVTLNTDILNSIVLIGFASLCTGANHPWFSGWPYGWVYVLFIWTAVAIVFPF